MEKFCDTSLQQTEGKAVLEELHPRVRRQRALTGLWSFLQILLGLSWHKSESAGALLNPNTAIVALSAWFDTVPGTGRLGMAELVVAEDAQSLQS